MTLSPGLLPSDFKEKEGEEEVSPYSSLSPGDFSPACLHSRDRGQQVGRKEDS